MLAVHAVDGVLLAEQGRADFQRGEMQRHQDHALAFALGLLQMLEPFNMGQLRQSLTGPPPAHRHFEKRNTGGGEVFLEQAFTLSRGLFRETQLQIALGNAPSVARHAIHQGPEHATKAQQCRIWQLHNQPQQPQATPQRPETWR
ncbi:hypothetical protein D3C84_1002530 [compost metagenome]